MSSEVRQWLIAQKLPDQLPEPFDYTLCSFHGIESVQGRDVPVVIFHFQDHGTLETAKVYAFRESQFDTRALQDAQASHWQAKKYPSVRGVTFVVTTTSPTLKPFLRTRNSIDT